MIGVTAKVKVNHAACRRKIHRQVHPQIGEMLFDLREIFNELFGGIKTGRIYRRARGSHQASAPGEPPARDTGALERSIIGPFFPALNRGQLRITAPHAKKLNRGTDKIAARPFVVPAVKLLIERRRKKGGRF